MVEKEYMTLIEARIQDKRHIVITGDRGSGKTTLLTEIRDRFEPLKCAPGLVTWAEPGKAVFAKELGSTDFAMVGEFNPDSLSSENRMRPVAGGFDIYGVGVLDRLISSASEWVTIDEIGYLEGTCPVFLHKLDELFNKKRVIAVLRKQNLRHINDIMGRDDAFTIDLDCYD